MEIYKEDLIICLNGNDSINEAFIKSAENRLVFPFLPFLEMNVSEAFKMGWIKEKIFGFFPSHFISGFEVKTEKFGEIKYGSKIYKTNTGFNITNIFFGKIKIKELIGEEVGDFSLKKVYIKLLPRALLFIKKKKIEELTTNDLTNLDILIKKEKEGTLFFLYDNLSETETVFRFDCEKSELPKDYRKIMEILPGRKLIHLDQIENVEEMLFIVQSHQDKNLIISKKNTKFLILKTI